MHPAKAADAGAPVAGQELRMAAKPEAAVTTAGAEHPATSPAGQTAAAAEPGAAVTGATAGAMDRKEGAGAAGVLAAVGAVWAVKEVADDFQGGKVVCM